MVYIGFYLQNTRQESDRGWQRPKRAQMMPDASFGHQMSGFFVLFATNEIFIAYISANLQNMQQRSDGGWQRPKWAQTAHLASFGPQVSFSFLFIYFSTLTKNLQYMQGVIYKICDIGVATTDNRPKRCQMHCLGHWYVVFFSFMFN